MRYKCAVLAGALFALILLGGCPASGKRGRGTPVVRVESACDRIEAERLLQTSVSIPRQRRVAFLSAYFMGRSYHPATKKRIKKQRSKGPKQEATNPRPLPVPFLKTSLEYLDCMTYVEHVLALACSEASYSGSFLPRLVDVMFDAKGQPLTNDRRNHFATVWAEVNERKGYLRDVVHTFPDTASRTVVLNKVGDNRTFFVEDRFMISPGPRTVRYVPSKVFLSAQAFPRSGDILLMVKEKAGLDVAHMGFFIEKAGKRSLRHASYKLNRIVDEGLVEYLKANTSVLGLVVLRPTLTPGASHQYRFVFVSQER